MGIAAGHYFQLKSSVFGEPRRPYSAAQSPIDVEQLAFSLFLLSLWTT
jgi:hypothetical protein